MSPRELAKANSQIANLVARGQVVPSISHRFMVSVGPVAISEGL